MDGEDIVRRWNAEVNRLLADNRFQERYLAPLAVAIGAALFAELWQATLEPRTVGIAMIVLVVAVILIGMPIAIALLLGGLLGLALIKHDFTIATRTSASTSIEPSRTPGASRFTPTSTRRRSS